MSVVVVVVLATGAVLWKATDVFTGSSAPAAAAPEQAPVEEAVPVGRLLELQTALSSADPAVQAGALDPTVFAALQASGQPLLPPGSIVRIDMDSSRVVGTSASVQAEVSGPRSGRFTVLLALESGVWAIYAAVPE